MGIKRGDIFWIRGNSDPTGNVQRQNRPGIIVSNDTNNSFSHTVEVVFLTTAPKKCLPTHCTIKSSNCVSTALCEQITTVSTDQLDGYVAH